MKFEFKETDAKHVNFDWSSALVGAGVGIAVGVALT